MGAYRFDAGHGTDKLHTSLFRPSDYVTAAAAGHAGPFPWRHVLHPGRPSL